MNAAVPLVGASTVPAARGQDAQRALLAARPVFARARGCPVAMMGAAPGSAERSGVRIACTRIEWHRAR